MATFCGIRAVNARIVFALSFCALLGCQPPPAGNVGDSSPGSPTTRTSAPLTSTPRTGNWLTSSPARDLTGDEAAGGHILRKHVGQTEQQLRERLERERNITGASTYTDRSTAEHVVGAAIAESQGQIERWLGQPGRHSNLVLEYENDVPIGRTMNRGERQSRVCAHALVVLKYVGPNDYYVLTSYPECR
ncbi:MAG: RNase A-like domain-containing protein [Terriglobales bacterium]|jgi:hypothetical protein